MADIKNKVITDFVANTGTAEKNVEKLTKTQKKQQDQTKKSTKSTKGFGSALGGLSSSVEGAQSQFGGATGKLGEFAQGFKVLKVAIASSGIGLIVVALAAIFAAFAKTQAGGDKLAQVFSAIGAAVDVITARVATLTDALGFILDGEWSLALDSAKDSFAGIGDEIKEATAAAADLVKEQQAFRDRSREIELQLAQNNTQIQEAIILTRDLQASEADRRKALQDATALELQNEALRNEQASTRLDFAEKELANVAKGLDNQEELKTLNDAQIAQENQKASSLSKQRELLNRTNEFENSILAKNKAINIELQRQEALREAARLAAETADEAERERFNAEAEAASNALFDLREGQDIARAEELESHQAQTDALLEINAERLRKELVGTEEFSVQRSLVLAQSEDRDAKIRTRIDKKAKKADEKRDSDLTDAKATNANSLSSLVAILGAKNAKLGKIIALAGIVQDTAKGISAAIAVGAASGPFPANLAAIASGVAAVLAGVLNAKTVLSQSAEPSATAADGILVGASHNSAAGGIPIMAEGGEAIINKRSMANPVLRSAASRINQAGGGIAFAQNGMLVGSSDASANARSIAADFETALGNAPTAVLVTEDFNVVNNRVRVTEETATLG